MREPEAPLGQTEELIQVKQLPIIEERLRQLKEEVDRQVQEAQALVCTEETIQSVKAARAALNKQYRALEDQRKAVKSAVLGPYEAFELAYRTYVGNTFAAADAALKSKIDAVEAEMKQRCEEGLREFFDEMCAAEHVDFLRFEQMGLKVDMASAKQKVPRKLREQVAAFVAGVSQSMNLIAELEDAEEIMVEFKQSLDAPGSIALVHTRHRRIEEEKASATAREEAREQEERAVKKVEAFAPPVVTPAETPKVVTVRFSVTDTVDRLKLLKQFLVANGYKYE